MSRREAKRCARRDVFLMHAENCYLVAESGQHQAAAWMFIWLLRLAGAPA